MSTFQTDIMFKQFDRCYKHCGTSNFIRIYWIFLQNWTAIYKPANIDILVIIRRKTNVSYNRYLYLKRINKKLKEKKLLYFFTILFISTWHHNITSFLSLLSERREMRVFRINAVLGLGVGSNPGPLAPKLCVLPCAPLHIH
jgi:hypothetical protein